MDCHPGKVAWTPEREEAELWLQGDPQPLPLKRQVHHPQDRRTGATPSLKQHHTELQHHDFHRNLALLFHPGYHRRAD